MLLLTFATLRHLFRYLLLILSNFFSLACVHLLRCALSEYVKISHTFIRYNSIQVSKSNTLRFLFRVVAAAHFTANAPVCCIVDSAGVSVIKRYVNRFVCSISLIFYSSIHFGRLAVPQNAIDLGVYSHAEFLALYP